MAPRHAYLGSLSQLADLELRGRLRAELVDITDTAAVTAACEDAALALQAEQLDLAAEGLRLAHDALGEITGRTLPDDLLGHIFASFCIGK